MRNARSAREWEMPPRAPGCRRCRRSKHECRSMKTLVRFQVEELEPPVGEVLLAQGLPGEDVLAPRLGGLVAGAFASYASLAEPRAVYEETTAAAFMDLLGPLAASDEHAIGRVAPRARALALYVATLG